MSSMRKKIEEYIEDLEQAIKRTHNQIENYTGTDMGMMKHIGYLGALIEVKNDLRSR